MSRKIQIGIGALLTIVVGAVFYFSFFAKRGPVKPSEIPASLEQAEIIRHPLTGERITQARDFFIVSVMYDNISESANRPGLEDASIVYEAPAEGGITRLMAIFDGSKEVSSIGPIRSARPYFVEWASEYGGVYMHVGGSPEALRTLRASDLVDIDQIGAHERYFSRDESLNAPHNVFTSFTSWLQIGERFEVPPHRLTPWQYEELAPHEPKQQQVEIAYWTGNEVAWAYNHDQNDYVRFLNGDRVLFSNGNQIAASNIVVMAVPTAVIDSIGRLRLDTSGSGPATIYRNGEAIDATWIKDSAEDRTRFVSTDQTEVVLNVGATWVEVISSLDDVTYSVFDAE